MIYFDNDYTEGAHPQVLERLVETNMIQAPGYGLDQFTMNAKEILKTLCDNQDIDIHFLSSGTQTNLIIIAAALRLYQGVITADTGHILQLEAGAIEAVGHKLLTIPGQQGKIQAEAVAEVAENYAQNTAKFHQIEPGMVYISHPTETGTLYTKRELKDLRAVCDTYNMKLFIDGARLGYGLAAETNDLSLHEITELSDVFYIGGTKIGALFGEAAVIRNDEIKKGFKTVMKQKGGLLAKGRALGIQFETLFKDNLYFDISEYAVKQAMRIKEALLNEGIELKYEAYTNQLFPILTDEQIAQIKEKYTVWVFGRETETTSIVRMCTSWGTTVENVDSLIEDIKRF